MNKDQYKILNDIVTLLEEKVENDFDNCYVDYKKISWTKWEKVKEVSDGKEEEHDTLVQRVELSFKCRDDSLKKHSHHNDDPETKVPYICISVELKNEEQTSYVKVRWHNRFRKSIRNAINLIDKTNKTRISKGMARLDSLHAKIKPDRIDDILLGNVDDGKSEKDTKN